MPGDQNDQSLETPQASPITPPGKLIHHMSKEEAALYAKANPVELSSPEPTLPNPIQITKNDKYSEKNDPPMIDVKITNPVTYLKHWLGRLLKNQDIDIRLRIKPFATVSLMLAFMAVGGTTFSVGRYLFPNSSPILHRQVVYSGTVQKGELGKYYLALEDSSLWKLQPKKNNVNLASLSNKKVMVTGNLTAEANLIEVSEIIVTDLPAPAQSVAPTLIPEPTRVMSSIELPKLYSNVQWEKDQNKVLIFTSGKRRIEQEGVYLESSLLTYFPQDFINYYTNQLTNSGFKQILNSTDPNGITITYSKDELFFTFGVKNSFQGSGELKQPTGYKTYLEHN